MLPRPHHPNLEAVDPKHPTRALAAAIHYQIRKKMFTKFPASQNKIADLFQVERKEFFTSITGHEYKVGKKMTKKKVKTSDTKEAKELTSPSQTDPEMPHWKTKMHQQDRSSLNLRSQYLPRNITKRSDRSIRPSCVFLLNSNYCIFFPVNFFFISSSKLISFHFFPPVERKTFIVFP